MTSQLQQMAAFAKEMQLDVLLDKERLFVLNSIVDQDENKIFKVVFSKQIVLGFVFGDTLYIYPEYWKGGKKYMFYFEREAQIIVQTYRLAKCVPLDLQGIEAELMSKLKGFKQLAERETDPDRMRLLADEAEELADQLQGEDAKAIFAEINVLNLKLQEKLAPQEGTKMNRLREISAALKTASPAEKKILADEATQIFTTMEDTEKTKALRVEISNTLQALRISAGNHSQGTPDEKALKEKQDKEYLDTVKMADKLFDEKKYAEAKVLYEKAQKIKPGMSRPRKQIDAIEKELRKSKKK